LNIDANEENINEIVADYDIVVDSSNIPFLNQLFVNTCRKLNKILIFAGINMSEGYVGCLLNPEKLKIELFNRIYNKPELNYVKSNIFIGTYSGIIGSMLANEVIKYFLALGKKYENQLYLINLLNNNLEIFE
jgi:sulfur-carrier protein adenylyltransferase/sulfurtransferase